MWTVFSTLNRTVAGDGWAGGTAGSVLGTVNLDLSTARPTGTARLRVISLLGTVNVRLPAGVPATVGGLSFLGTINGERDGGPDPLIRVSYFSLAGTVNVQG
jgi:hypothetical protein